MVVRAPAAKGALNMAELPEITKFTGQRGFPGGLS